MQSRIAIRGYILVTLLGLSSSNPINPATENGISKREPTELPSSIEYLGCWCTGVFLYTFSSTNITLKDSYGRTLANVSGTCSYYKNGPTGDGCSLGGVGDVTVGNYLVHHPDAYFGPCGFNSSYVEVSLTSAEGEVRAKNLTVECFKGTDACTPFGDICGSSINPTTITSSSA